jgi:hypothetical protein
MRLTSAGAKIKNPESGVKTTQDESLTKSRSMVGFHGTACGMWYERYNMYRRRRQSQYTHTHTHTVRVFLSLRIRIIKNDHNHIEQLSS